MPIDFTIKPMPTSGTLSIFEPQKNISLTMTNNCDELVHLAIYDYKLWRASRHNEETLFALDASSDNMSSASTMMQAAAKNSGLYLIRAYFDFSQELEAIVHLPANKTSLTLEIKVFDNAPFFATQAPAKFLSEIAAEKILNQL
jgi:hypothetical protein